MKTVYYTNPTTQKKDICWIEDDRSEINPLTNIFNDIENIQYKNRDDYSITKQLVLSEWISIWSNHKKTIERSNVWDYIFRDIIKEYIQTLLKEHWGERLYKLYIKAKNEENSTFPILFPFESVLYNRLYRSLYWGYIKKSEYSNLNS